MYNTHFDSPLYQSSSVSSNLSGTAAIIWEDLLKWKFPDIPQAKAARINKALGSTHITHLDPDLPAVIKFSYMGHFEGLLGSAKHFTIVWYFP